MKHSPFGSTSVATLALFLVTAATASAQVEYPAATHAIPIPKMADLPLLPGPFQGNVESLKQYQTPDWFRDAKFGIWSHWGPQSFPDEGEWNGRHMYEEGSDDYKDHLKRFGHPSKFGYKDILPLWKAERWDPDRLMKLYKAAGAHYFFAQAVHHDNFDNWNSKYHKWNSVNLGPKKDIVGLWQKAARKQGLRFGVSEHLGASFTWFQGSHGADKDGPYAGVPYDGANPAYWDLYHLPAKPGDSGWYTNDPRWIQEWYARIYDLIDQYKPDLLYSDGGLPFKGAGMNIVAQLYNLSVQQNQGKLEAVYCCKKDYSGTDYYNGVCVQDVERGGMNDIQPFVWQTDTSTGAWFYNKNQGYKSSDEVIHTLMDIVSKNGNLLLNIVQYADGSLPPEMETFLKEMAAWMKINDEAVFGTRPWTIYGEGPTTAKQGAFKDDITYTGRDIRFTRKGSDLYATTLGVPTKQVVIRALSSNSPLVTGSIQKVVLLGYDGDLPMQRTAEGLILQLPDALPLKSTLCFKITGLTTVADVPPETLNTFRAGLVQ
jgi:alpha-L-fucosidase